MFLIADSGVIFYSSMPLYDLITGLQSPDFSLTCPKIRLFTELFYSLSFYILTLSRDFYRP
ncbi:MAG: hypothetical protein LBN01_02165 [Endomicrobium sp.]|nr:hypothetical protein [Endomicrobium sp.]